MFHEVEVDIGPQPELLVHLVRVLDVAATRTTGRPRRQHATNLPTLEFLRFSDPLLRDVLVRVKGLDLPALESVKMVGVEQFLVLLRLHGLVQVLDHLEHLLVVQVEGH